MATQNPYWNEIHNKGIDDIYSIRSSTKRSSMASSLLWASRHEYCGKYSWSIPDPASIAFVAEHLGAKAVEMGAGMGYYAWQLAQSGVDILCYDIAPPSIVTDNHYHSPRTGRYEDFSGETVQTYHPVLQGTPDLLQRHADRSLFLCWPPMSDMATQCLEHYRGNKLVYIGESDGGCTADEAFFEVLEKDWTAIASHNPLQWDGIHDYIEVYERKDK